jgi:SAM-dependent methyltransferase
MAEQPGNDYVNVRHFREAARGSAPAEDEFAGLPIHAAPGLHDFIATHAEHSFLPCGSVLDLAAGTGALCLRLSQHGFRVTAADLVPENFRLHGTVPFVTANLNRSFADALGATFDGILAVEVIEHLENPRHFLRECGTLLNPGGCLILTTPNVDNPVSKLSFVRRGRFQWFWDGDYDTFGHITPLTQWQVRCCLEEVPLEIVSLGSFGNPYRLIRGSWRAYVAARLIGFMGDLDPGLRGEVLVAVARRPAGPTG